MRQPHSSVRAVAAGALVIALGTSAAPTVSALPSQSTGTPGPARPDLRTVTLVTGDRVEASPDLKKLRFVPGPGRERVNFSIRRAGQRVYVVPLDALRALNRQQLDPRLFELNELLAYDDKRRQDLPLIVTGAPRARDAAVAAAGGTKSKPLAAIGSVATRVPKNQLTGFYGSLTREAGITKIWLDGIRKPLLDKSVPQIGAPAVWANGFTGKGVKVAVLDGGVDGNHPDLKGRVTNADFTGTDPGDVDGHGTHVASTVAGSGAASDSRYRGVAPDAEILSGKVCRIEACYESEILAGMDWAVDQGAKVVNLSLGGGNGPDLDPLEQAVNKYSASTLFVIAAGNYGAPGSIASPGSAADALTVGAVDAEDRIAEFSSRGPTEEAGAIKPDVTAPGVGIVAAKSATSTIGEPVGTSYLRLSGTSMSTPHVAGAAALLAQAHPDWTGPQLKAALVGSAKVLPDLPMTAQGSGRIDVAAAAKLTVLPNQPAVGFDEQRWPHADDKPQAKEVTYTNHGDAPVQLELKADFKAPDGQPAPEGALQLSTSSLTVPAKGSAKVTVTSNTNHAGPDGEYTGRLLAAVQGTTTTTTATLAVRKEVESYDLTIKHLDRDGKPTADYWDWVVDRAPAADQDNSVLGLDGTEGVSRIRLPKGQYLLETIFGRQDLAVQLVQPQLDLTSDRTLTMDARHSKPIQVAVPDQSVRNALTMAGYELHTVRYNYGGGVGSDDGRQLFVSRIGPNVPNLTGTVDSEWAVPDPAGDGFTNSPVVFQLHWSKLDGSYDGFRKDVRYGELAALRPTIRAEAEGTQAGWFNDRIAPHINSQRIERYGYTKLPATPTIYVTRASSFRWQPSVAYSSASEGTLFKGRLVTCRVGQTCADTWGKAVFGPALPAPGTTRTGDVLTLSAGGTDAQGRDFTNWDDNGSFTLYRNGAELGKAANDRLFPATLPVPAGPGDYQLDFTASAGAMSLSTKTFTSWKFKSDTATSRTALPLWVAAFQPPVDLHNTVRGSHELPFQVTAQAGAQVGNLKEVKAWTSTDDGKNWTEAPVRGSGTQRRAIVTTPTGEGHISLRVEASDSAGNSVKQEIQRAYKFAG